VKQNNFTLGGKIKHWRKNKHAQSKTDDGDIVVARKGNDYTIKRFRKTVSETWLEPANHNFAFGKSEFQIVGIVKDILRILKE